MGTPLNAPLGSSPTPPRSRAETAVDDGIQGGVKVFDPLDRRLYELKG